ncbi:MAG TPA: HAMP domain-containing sensor histidine kinase, partial [Roseiflexaceae bacterium]|nr:HAMP domain-containing sensor histidine kinase [Roseiflexaceae bacterium]
MKKNWTNSLPTSPALIGALLALLVLLATLQYYWLREVNAGDRERMQSIVDAGAVRFGEDFDLEVARMYLTFQIDSQAVLTRQWDRYAQRYEHWIQHAPYHKLVGAVYLVELYQNGRVNLSLYNPSGRRFAPAEWPAAMGDLRGRLEQSLKATRIENGVLVGNTLDPVDETIPAVIIPVTHMDLLSDPEGSQVDVDLVFGETVFRRKPCPRCKTNNGPLVAYTVVALDLPYLRQEYIPNLARKYFASNGKLDYNVSIVSRKEPDRLFYHSNTNIYESAPLSGDATANLFSARLDEFNRLLLDDSFDLSDLPALNDSRAWRVALSRSPIAEPASGTALAGSDGGRWRLILNHRAGSLDRAVSNLLLKNLLISFGILLMLGISVLILVVATRRAQRLAQQKMEFVAAISHELRTPLAVICSAGENLADGVVPDPQRARQYGKVIHNEGRRLAEMVDQALEFAGAQSGRKTIVPRPIEIRELLDRAMAACQPELNDSGFRVEERIDHDLPMVLADAAEISRALQNLIRNAIKYGGGQQWIGLQAQAQSGPRGGEVSISVRDNGLGIPPADLPHIFEPFYRAHEAVAAQIHGSGLGLSVVRQIVEAHGGRITVESELGKGSAFTIYLPCATNDGRQPTIEGRRPT